MSIAFFSGGHGTYRTRAGAGDVDQQRDEIAVRRSARDPPTLNTWPLQASDAPARRNASAASSTYTKSRICDPSPKISNLPPFEREADEPADEALPVVLDELARSVHVRQPQRAGADVEHVVVEQVIVLAGGLVDAVHVDRPDEMIFGDRQRVGLAVNLARAGEHHLHRAD